MADVKGLKGKQNDQGEGMLKNLRVQRKRTKGYRQPAGCISVARPSMWGNPFETAAEYRKWLTTEWQPDARKEPHWNIFHARSLWGKWNYALLAERKHYILTHIKELCGKQLS
jgi:hypothetical protein